MTIHGAKNKYSKFLCPILQKCIDENHVDTFFDVCCGGSNIIKNIKCENRIAIDIDRYLIALYHEMQKPNFEFPSFPSSEDWDRCKNGEEERDWYVGLVKIFTSYLARGFGGGYNKQERQYWGRVHTMQKELPLIQNIEYRCADYHIIDGIENAVIYLDPPYYQTKKYDQAPDFDHNEFWATVRRASEKNWVFVSEQTAPEDFTAIWSLETERILQGTKFPCVENLFVFNSGLSAKFHV